MVAKQIQSCYTVSIILERCAAMKDGRKVLPEGWQVRIGVIAASALAGNFLVGVIPWPEDIMAAYEASMAPAASQGLLFLLTALVAAPLAEEAAFRLLLYGWLRRFMGYWPAALISALAFGIYHGNWIQGTYAFMTGMILAWGYETSGYRKYAVAVLMHGAANLTALAVFGL